MKKRYTVHVKGHAFLEEMTYRILAISELEAKRKAEEKFNMETAHTFDHMGVKVKTRGKRG